MQWVPGPVVALFIGDEFIGMFSEMTLERRNARRLVHISDEEIPQVVERLPQMKFYQAPQYQTLDPEPIKQLPPDANLIRDCVIRNKRLGFSPKPDVEAMLAELGLHEWE